MHVKGEGTPVNLTHAITLYEEAAAKDSVRALNGLGYLYFYGQQAPHGSERNAHTFIAQNHTRAFQYFLQAASYENDGDAVFNAAYCLEHGFGTPKSLSRAVYYYGVGAQRLGHFGSVHALARMYLEVSHTSHVHNLLFSCL